MKNYNETSYLDVLNEMTEEEIMFDASPKKQFLRSLYSAGHTGWKNLEFCSKDELHPSFSTGFIKVGDDYYGIKIRRWSMNNYNVRINRFNEAAAGFKS